jgi:hypothetical protein
VFDYNAATISKHEAVIRVFAGTTLILAVLVNPTVPPWLALAAIYPVMSGIIQWDPLIGAFLLLYKKQFMSRNVKRYLSQTPTYRKAYNV